MLSHIVDTTLGDNSITYMVNLPCVDDPTPSIVIQRCEKRISIWVQSYTDGKYYNYLQFNSVRMAKKFFVDCKKFIQKWQNSSPYLEEVLYSLCVLEIET